MFKAVVRHYSPGEVSRGGAAGVGVGVGVGVEPEAMTVGGGTIVLRCTAQTSPEQRCEFESTLISQTHSTLLLDGRHNRRVLCMLLRPNTEENSSSGWHIPLGLAYIHRTKDPGPASTC